MTVASGALAHDWTDDDGQPLGSWVEIERDEWQQVAADAGGFDSLVLCATLTDPDGTYGTPQIYTSWGRRGDSTPLLDVRDYKDDSGRSILRKFIPREDQH